MTADLTALENLFLGLADKTRLRLLGLMAEGPVSVGHLVAETGDSQPKISRHLAYLRNAGLVDTTREGKWIYYGVADLSDGRAASVYRCVVGELNGGDSKRSPRSVPVSRSEPASDSPTEGFSSTNAYTEEYSGAERDDQYDQNQPDEGHNELDIFLL